MTTAAASVSAPILVIGSGGRLGASLVAYFQEKQIPVLGWTREDVDLADHQALARKLEETHYQHVIISAAMTSLEACEMAPERALAVNATAPGIIARHTAARGPGHRCLYISTDYVYDGSEPGLKAESAPLRPLGVYAATKLAGEAGQDLVARTSWIFGPHRPSFVDQILRQAQAGEPLAAIADKFSAPSYSLDLAASLADLLFHPASQGVYNVTNAAAPDVSWHTLAEKTLQLAVELKILSKAPPSPVIPQQVADMKAFLAPRPIYTTANTARLASLLGKPMRPWEDALRDYLAKGRDCTRENPPKTILP